MTWQKEEDGSITEWEWRSVILGACILVALIIAVVIIQRNIDAGYAVKRKEVEASIEQQQEKDRAAKAALEAKKAADPEGYVWDRVRALIAGQPAALAKVKNAAASGSAMDISLLYTPSASSADVDV